ncbi:MAG: hypothetical protein AB2745_08440 [Candidatus Thiodiazotropha endolucinida]
MTTTLNSAVLALENINQRLFRIDVICALLKGMESGDINIDDNITGGITLMTVVVESLDFAMSDAFEDCSKVQNYIEAQTGEHFTRLVENAKQAELTVSSDELREVLS